MPFFVAGAVIFLGGLLVFGGAARKLRPRRQFITRVKKRVLFWRRRKQGS